MIRPQILLATNNYSELDDYIYKSGEKTVFLVCDNAIRFLRLDNYFNSLPERLGVSVIRFSDFQPNPYYESVVEGVNKFKAAGSNQIIAVGGGSAMDVAKCIKLYANLNSSDNYLEQIVVPNYVKLLAVPTTAGTGSEATRYAVIYYKGMKQSVTDDSIIPSVVLMDPSTLQTLPPYQKKSTMLDALCHAIESFWSINSTKESRGYSKEAIQLILANKEAYLNNTADGNANMLYAAYTAGRAINITQTTAGHAMCYKLTSMFHIAHGHAAALCVSKLWIYMLKNTNRCVDSRGDEYFRGILDEIAESMSADSAEDAAWLFGLILSELNLGKPENVTPADYDTLKASVNLVRLKNNPVILDLETIDKLYHDILT